MKLIIVCKNRNPFHLEIDGNKTILDLKKQIASHYNETYIGFNVLNGNDLIDASKNGKTINDLGIKRVVRLPDNYEPGSL